MSSDLLREFGEVDLNPLDADHDDTDFGAFEEPYISDAPSERAQQQISENEDILHGSPAENEEEVTYDDDEDFGGLVEASNKDFQTPRSTQDQVPFDSREYQSGMVLFDAEADSAMTLPSASLNQQRQDMVHEVTHRQDYEDDGFVAWEPVHKVEDPFGIPALAPQPPALGSSCKMTEASSTKGEVLGPPPTNIPPPSVLLSLSTSILQKLTVTAKQNAALTKDRKDVPNRRPLSTLHSMAHILSGRKLRWKRDSILSQQMSIGQAGKAGGMKLTSLDKTETRREEQEAAELVKTWRSHAGLLRSIMSAMGKQALPDIAENLPVRTGKLSEGALTAPKPCFICGLKRDERVLRVDGEVEDSFGEFWLDHWGHRDCVEFWNEHKGSLPQR